MSSARKSQFTGLLIVQARRVIPDLAWRGSARSDDPDGNTGLALGLPVTVVVSVASIEKMERKSNVEPVDEMNSRSCLLQAPRSMLRRVATM